MSKHRFTVTHQIVTQESAGERTLGEMDALDRAQLLRSLDAYNRLGAGVWQYWAAS